MKESHRPVHRELQVWPESQGPEATWDTSPQRGHSIFSLWDPTQGQRQLPEPGPPGIGGGSGVEEAVSAAEDGALPM